MIDPFDPEPEPEPTDNQIEYEMEARYMEFPETGGH